MRTAGDEGTKFFEQQNTLLLHVHALLSQPLHSLLSEGEGEGEGGRGRGRERERERGGKRESQLEISSLSYGRIYSTSLFYS